MRTAEERAVRELAIVVKARTATPTSLLRSPPRNGTDILAAVYAYNLSQTNVAEVLSYAASYTAEAPRVAAPSTTAANAVAYALDQIGPPHRRGGETPGVGFDCSELIQAAYGAAGITIPPTSEAQWSVVAHVPFGQLEPGDLVFFNPGELIAGLPGHVGVYIGNEAMVDAPHRRGRPHRGLAAWPTPMGGAARPSAGRAGARRVSR